MDDGGKAADEERTVVDTGAKEPDTGDKDPGFSLGAPAGGPDIRGGGLDPWTICCRAEIGVERV